jgi:membrane protease YdiL (CAAX protease family)
VPHRSVTESIPAAEQPIIQGEGAAMPESGGEKPVTLQQRLIALGEVLLCSGLVTQNLIGAILQLAGWSAQDERGLSLPFVLTMSLADTLVLLTIMVALSRAHGESPTDLWIGRRGIKREVALGVLLVPVVFLGVIVLLNLMRIFAPGLHNVQTNPLEKLASTVSDAAMFALVAIVAGGVREELQRAFLLRRFEQYLGGAAVGVIVLSVAFGLAHLLQGWDAVITTGTLGAFWAIVYLRRRSSVAPIVSHAGFNALEILRVTLTG